MANARYHLLLIVTLSSIGSFLDTAGADELRSRLNQALKRFPEADANGDGILSLEEVRIVLPEADADGDGTLSPKEARDFWEKRRARRGNRAKATGGATPTHANVKYGSYEKNTLDLYLAESDQPTPLLICIHGGGFRGGDKRTYSRPSFLRTMHEAGVSVASINYRLIDGGRNPYPIPMLDSARAVQYLRHHADRFNLDKSRFAATGGSAGGCIVLWIGFREDLADPANEDPVLRESTRLTALAPKAALSSLHLPTLCEWFEVESLVQHVSGPSLFVVSGSELEMAERRDALTRDASPINHLTPDDPPLYLVYGRPKPVTSETPSNVWVHHAQLGIKLKQAADAIDVECHLEYPGGPESTYASAEEFLIAKLKK